MSELGSFLITVVFMSQEKLLPINPTRWPTFLNTEVNRVDTEEHRENYGYGVFKLSEEEPFSDNSRFHEPRKTFTYQSDKMAHFSQHGSQQS
jgi:hypothetical protein